MSRRWRKDKGPQADKEGREAGVYEGERETCISFGAARARG